VKHVVPFEMYTATGTVDRAATSVIATFAPPVKGYICGVYVTPTTNIVAGTTVVGVVAAYKNSTELGALTLSSDQDVGEFFAIPLTTTPHLTDIAITPTDTITVQVKTRPTGSPSGAFRAGILIAMDEREVTAPTFLEPYHALT
jgi:hypothetical protein